MKTMDIMGIDMISRGMTSNELRRKAWGLLLECHHGREDLIDPHDIEILTDLLDAAFWEGYSQCDDEHDNPDMQ